ncbi:MAG TPA: GNAT family N-acetyltransferase [Caldilineaceae bacterium]|nr:GNAT family N-acetyltransferase [Caldilineaceae bacterium]
MADASTLATLATSVFRETYGAAIPDEILTPYLARTFSPAAFRTMATDPTVTLLVATVGEQIGGYGKLVGAPQPTGKQEGHAVALSTLYIARAQRGHGLGRALMTEALSWAAQQGYLIMWLCVWQENPGAKAFYEGLNFVVVGTTEIAVDGIIFQDWVMSRSTTATDRGRPSPT